MAIPEKPFHVEKTGVGEALELVGVALDAGVHINSIDAIRLFDSAHPDSDAYYWQVPGFSKNRFSVVVITDPALAFQTLKQQNAVTTDTIFHNSHQHIRGRFVVTEHNQEQWTADKRHVGKGFFSNSEALRSMPYTQVSKASLERVIGQAPTEQDTVTLSPNWLKYLSASQITHHLAGQQIPEATLYPAIDALLDISNHPISLLTLGTLKKSPLKKKLKPYYELVDYIVANRTQDSILEKVLRHILEHSSADPTDTVNQYSTSKDIEVDTTKTLIAGLSTMTAAFQSIFLHFSKNPELQTKIIEQLQQTQKSELLTSSIFEAMRIYPPAPFIVRGITETIEIGDKTFSSGYVVVPQATFGGEKHEDVYGTNPHFDGIFGTGPRRCIAQHYAPLILESTLATLFNMGLTISCTNDPQPVIKGVALRFSEPLEFKLHDSQGKYTVLATSAA